MINIEDFIKRLEVLLEHYGMSASSFSDTIGIQRSGISHLLSGRNKPSLDFVMKIITAFPEVDLYWLLTGQGSLLKGEMQSPLAHSKPDQQTDRIIIFHSDGTFSQYTPKK